MSYPGGSTLTHVAVSNLPHDGKGKSGLSEREWNAFIGIVTAIVGNILISFALNLQRYAHISLNRDKLRRQKSWATERNKRLPQGKGYGTQEELAQERADLNLEAPPPDEEDEEHRARYHDAIDEESPLNGNRSATGSFSSTIRPGEKVEDEDFKAKTYLKSGYWWAGIILMTFGEAGNFLAYGFAPASIVSPLGVVALISNCIIAPCLLKERFRQRDFWGVVVAVGGAVTVVFSAENGEKKLGPHAIWAAITRWEFELYLGLTVAAIIALMWASEKYGEKSILIDLGVVALFGAYTALTTKGVASLLSDTLWRVITFPVFYLLVFILITTALAQIRYINRALQRFDSTQVIPTQFVLFTLSVITGSAVLYRDFESTSAQRMGKFVGGCALTFTGVYLITSGRRKEHIEEEEDDISAEGIRLVDEEAQEYGTHASEHVNGHAPSITEETEGESSADPFNPSRQQSFRSGGKPRTPQRIGSDLSSVVSTPFNPSSLESPLGGNPWALSQEQLASQERQVPNPAQIRRELSSSSKLGPYRPTTPGGPPIEDAAQAPTSKDERRSSIFRKSLVYPSPLFSPLSGALSGIVQDSLRRGVDTPSKSLRSRHSGASRLKSFQGTEDSARPAEAGRLLPRSTSHDPRQGMKARSQSISDAFGSLFRSKSSRSRGSLGGDDEEYTTRDARDDEQA